MTRRVRRGAIFTADIEPVRGLEQGKVRPAVIIQNDIGNQFSPMVIVSAITSGRRVRFDVNAAVESPEGGLTKDSIILLNQIRTIDKSRLGRCWGRLDADKMAQVDEALKISLGLVPI
jgi:mRNA interferase MazF